MRDFEKYEVYKDSMQLTIEIYKVSVLFPDEEKFGLVGQMRRAAVSIPSNIAEASSRSSPKDFARLLQIALGSAFELYMQINISNELKSKDTEKSTSLIDSINSIRKQLNGLIKATKA